MMRVMDDRDDPQHAEPHPDLLALFEVFRRPQSPGDLEDQVRPGPPAIARFGLLPSRVRRVSVSSSLHAWVAPGTKGAALSTRLLDRGGSHSTGSWSGPAESVVVRGLLGWSVSLEGVETYYGLVPDGNHSVAMTLIDGTRSSVAVVENVFIAQPADRVRSVEFRDGNGNQDIRATGIEPAD